MKNLLFVSVLMFFVSTVFCQTSTPPAAGDGSSGNPYQIATIDNLYWVTQTSSSWGSHFVQTAGIDASGSSAWAAGAGFSPIGKAVTPFTGSYDGQGYTITGLNINQLPSFGNYIGLFGYVSIATIKNITLASVNITGYEDVGSLIGDQYEGTVTSCSSSGSVTGHINIGGLIGYEGTATTATNCSSTASVSGTGTGNEEIGGLIGEQNYNCTATSCFSTGSVIGQYAVGGLIGEQITSSATNCFSTGAVTGSQYVGGLIGWMDPSDNASNCYSSGSVTGTTNFGGLIGFQTGTNIVSNCFWDMQTSGQGSSSGGTGKNTTDMQTSSTFLTAGWSGTIWNLGDGLNAGYPYLKWQNPGGTSLPVELTSFIVTASNSTIILSWNTATEVNNYGFDVERRIISNQQINQPSTDAWLKDGFVQGDGTSNAPHNYSFTDNIGNAGTYSYRLKQIDNSGTFKYSMETQVTIEAPKIFSLAQNYPNPFNPTTTISFSLPSNSFVSLRIFDITGREITTIVSEEMPAGNYSRQWNASNMPSGIYFYRIQVGSFTETKKLTLLK
jgi:hypothetical protein